VIITTKILGEMERDDYKLGGTKLLDGEQEATPCPPASCSARAATPCVAATVTPAERIALRGPHPG